MVAMSEENPSIEPSSTMEPQQQAASDTDAELRDAADPVASDDATKTEAAEADQDQDLDLDQEEQEKQPMTGGADRSEDAPSAASESAAADAAAVCEKNGALKLKIQEEEEEVKFTGLTKEELLRVAGTPGWVLHTRTQCSGGRQGAAQLPASITSSGLIIIFPMSSSSLCSCLSVVCCRHTVKQFHVVKTQK